MTDSQRAAFEAWCKERFGQIPIWDYEDGQYIPTTVRYMYETWQAALQSPEAKTTQAMAECMDMVRNELIEAGIISDKVAPMFVANAVFEYVRHLRKDAAYYRWLRANWTRLRTTYHDNTLRFSVVADSFCEITEADIDAAIIAAMEKQK